MGKKKIAVIGNEDTVSHTIVERLADQIDAELIDMSKSNASTFENPPYIIQAPDLTLDQQVEDIKYSHLSKKEREADIKPIRNSKKDPKIQRNAPCPCGSGKKYKKCYLNK